MENGHSHRKYSNIEHALNSKPSGGRSVIIEDLVEDIPKSGHSNYGRQHLKSHHPTAITIDETNLQEKPFTQPQSLVGMSLGPKPLPRIVKRKGYHKQVLSRLCRPNNFNQMTGNNELVGNNPHSLPIIPNPARLENLPKIIRLSSAYDEIRHQIASDFEGNCGNFFLLTGSSGHGKTSAVYYAANEIVAEYKRKADKSADDHMPVFVEVDCVIYRDESKIMARILDCFANQGLPTLHNQAENNCYLLLSKYFENYKVMLYFKNVDVLAEESRQTFLYTLMESLKALARRYTIIFGTTNINFREKLDRRIWSRLSSKDFVFEETTVEGVRSVLADRLSPPVIAGRPEFDYHEETKIMLKILDTPSIRSYIKRELNLGMGVGWFVHLFKTAFMMMGSGESTNEDSPFNKFYEAAEADYLMIDVPCKFHDLLTRASSLITFESGFANMLNQLCHPQKLIVFTLWEHGISSGLDTVMSFDILRRRQKEISVSYNNGSADLSMFKKNKRPHLSDDAIKYSLTMLKTLGLVHLDKVPITMDTLIQLADCLNPCFISGKFQEGTILFEGK